MDSDEMKRMELSIHGRVQGVGFRHFTVRTSEKLNNVTGWVKNEPDGSVTLVAEGPRNELEQLYNQVNEGPRRARVDSIDRNMKEYKHEFSSFGVKY